MVKVLWLSDADVKKVLNMRKALEANEEAFKAKGLKQVQMPAKLLLNFERYEGDLRAMPAYIETLDIAGVKIVNSHPNNPEKYGLPCVMAVIVLNDPKTGSTIALMDGTYITNMRTGAAGGIAIKYLARKNSRVIGMIGAGAQARTQLMAAKEILSEIDEVRVWSRTRTSSEKFVQEMQALGFNLNFKIFDSPKDAVVDSDIIVTTTPAREPIVQNDWVNEGTHINAIGADACYPLDTEVMTPDGFIPISNLKVGMTVWSMNPMTRELEKAKIIKIYVNEHKGEMIKVKTLYTNFLVTPNHNIPNFSRDGKRFLGFIKADELDKRWQTVTTVKAKWNGKKEKFFVLPKIKRSNNRQKEYKFRLWDWMEFLGWYISEGCLHHSNYSIEIFQCDKNNKERIRKLLTRMGLKITEIKDGLSFGSKQIYEYLKSNVGKVNIEKRIPQEFLELDRKYLLRLFNSLIDGDGWRKRTKGNKEKCEFSTSSKMLVDNIIELAIKLGRFCTVYFKGRGRLLSGRDGDRIIHPINPVYIVGIGAENGYSTRSVYKNCVERVEMNCVVGCPQLDKNHILITRYNGKVIMNGNSGKEELDPRILKRAKIVVDDLEQAWHGGEINVPVKKGLIKKEDIYVELGEIIAGKKSGRISDEEITVFDSTGLAVQDVVTAYFIYNEAIKQKIGRILEL